MTLRSTLAALLALWIAFAIRHPKEVSVAPHAQTVTCAASGAVLCAWLLGQPLDINRATADELRLLPNIGSALARRIVDYRQQHGPFSSMQALTAVRGIGARTVSKLEGLVSVGSSTQPGSKRNSQRNVTVK